MWYKVAIEIPVIVKTKINFDCIKIILISLPKSMSGELVMWL